MCVRVGIYRKIYNIIFCYSVREEDEEEEEEKTNWVLTIWSNCSDVSASRWCRRLGRRRGGEQIAGVNNASRAIESRRVNSRLSPQQLADRQTDTANRTRSPSPKWIYNNHNNNILYTVIVIIVVVVVSHWIVRALLYYWCIYIRYIYRLLTNWWLNIIVDGVYTRVCVI